MDRKKVSSILRVMCALFIVWTLHYDIFPVEPVQSDFLALSLLETLQGSVGYFGLIDIVAFIGILAVIKFAGDRSERPDRCALMLSAVYSLLFVTCMSFRANGTFDFFDANLYQRMIAPICVAGYWLLFYYILRAAFILMENAEPEDCRRDGAPKLLWLKGALVISLCWLPALIINYPGNLNFDSDYQMRIYLGIDAPTAINPPLGTALMGWMYSLGAWLADGSFGVFLYVLLQSAMAVLAFSLSVKKIYELYPSRRLYWLSILFFALVPMWGSFAQWVEKDLLYVDFAVINAVYMMDVLARGKCDRRSALWLTVSGIMASLLRHNGLYAILPAAVLLLFTVKKADRKRLAASSCVVLAVFLGVTKLLYPALGFGKNRIGAAFSIPFQQTARYICQYGDEVTDYEKQVIGETLNLGYIAHYNPTLSDVVHHGYCDDNSKLPEYFKVWYQMLLKHPRVYAEAFFNMCYGHLAPVDENFEAVNTYGPGRLSQFGVSNRFEGMATETYESAMIANIYSPLAKYFYMPGMYTWIVVACMALLGKHKKRGALILFVPSVVNIAVCIGSPVYNLMRYALPMVASTPMLIGWTLYSLREKPAPPDKTS